MMSGRSRPRCRDFERHRGCRHDTRDGSMLKVFCARSMHVAVKAVADTFANATGEAADIVFEPMGALQARLAARENADVLVLGPPSLHSPPNGRSLGSTCSAPSWPSP